MSDMDSGDAGHVILARLSTPDGSLTVVSSVTICEGFSWRVEMQGNVIPPQHFASITGNLDSVTVVASLITVVNNRGICCGSPDEKFHMLVKARKGKFMDSSGTYMLLL